MPRQQFYCLVVEIRLCCITPCCCAVDAALSDDLSHLFVYGVSRVLQVAVSVTKVGAQQKKNTVHNCNPGMKPVTNIQTSGKVAVRTGKQKKVSGGRVFLLASRMLNLNPNREEWIF